MGVENEVRSWLQDNFNDLLSGSPSRLEMVETALQQMPPTAFDEVGHILRRRYVDGLLDAMIKQGQKVTDTVINGQSALPGVPQVAILTNYDGETYRYVKGAEAKTGNYRQHVAIREMGVAKDMHQLDTLRVPIEIWDALGIGDDMDYFEGLRIAGESIRAQI